MCGAIPMTSRVALRIATADGNRRRWCGRAVRAGCSDFDLWIWRMDEGPRCATPPWCLSSRDDGLCGAEGPDTAGALTLAARGATLMGARAVRGLSESQICSIIGTDDCAMSNRPHRQDDVAAAPDTLARPSLK